MNASVRPIVVGAHRRGLDVKPLKRQSDSAALWLSNNVHTLLVVRVRIRIIRRRYVAGCRSVHSAAGLATEHSRNTQ